MSGYCEDAQLAHQLQSTAFSHPRWTKYLLVIEIIWQWSGH